MPLHKTFGVDLGTSTVKIYSQDQDTVLTEKNMIAYSQPEADSGSRK